MRKITRQIQIFLKNFVGDSTGIGRIPKSAAFISPGDVLMLTYPKSKGPPETVIVLVVSNKTGSGLFISTKKNILISCYRIDQSHTQVLEIILGALYKNRKSSSYSKIKSSLSTILGSSSYRTYKLNKVFDLQELVIHGK